MRYFFLAYALLTVVVIGVAGVRGQKFSHTPFELFPDMDRQDKVKSQKPEPFFSDGVGARQPVQNTTPSHFSEETAVGDQVRDFEFSTGRTGYYYTGKEGADYYNGMPEELKLTEDTVGAFLRRGQERFGIYCSACHGEYGNGGGIASKLGVPGVANLLESSYYSPAYSDGQLYEVISKGKGNMGGYGYNIPVRDRWAIIAYVRTLQRATTLPDDQKQAILLEKAKSN